MDASLIKKKNYKYYEIEKKILDWIKRVDRKIEKCTFVIISYFFN